MEIREIQVGDEKVHLRKLNFREKILVDEWSTKYRETKDANCIANRMAQLFAYSVCDKDGNRQYDLADYDGIDLLDPDFVNAVAGEAYTWNWAKELERIRKQEKLLKKALATLSKRKRR